MLECCRNPKTPRTKFCEVQQWRLASPITGCSYSEHASRESILCFSWVMLYLKYSGKIDARQESLLNFPRRRIIKNSFLNKKRS